MCSLVRVARNTLCLDGRDAEATRVGWRVGHRGQRAVNVVGTVLIVFSILPVHLSRELSGDATGGRP